MADKPKKAAPPYATFPSFLNFLNKLRDTQVPSRIDPSVFGNASGSLSYSIISALKVLKLIDAEGVPSDEFVAFVKAEDEARKPMMLAILKSGYPSLFNGSLDLSTATAGQFDEHIRQEYDAKGSTIDKVATFFIAAAKFSELPISPHLAARKPIASSASSGKSRRQRKTDAEQGNAPPPPPPPPQVISEKALEYRLVDLMSEAAGDADVMEAIIKVITFLKTKDAAKSSATSSDDFDDDEIK